MKKFEGFLFVCDLDGTILNDQLQILEKNSLALRHFVAEGGLFSIATGRIEIAIERYLKSLPINMPVILYNGASIYDTTQKKIIWENPINENLNQLLIEILQKYPEITIELFHKDGVYVTASNHLTQAHSKKDGFNIIEASLNNIPTPWYKITFVGNHVTLLELKTDFDSKFISSKTFFTDPHLLELVQCNTSKGEGLNILKKLYGIQNHTTIALGDGANDLELIENATFGFCVNDASEILKQKSHLLSRTHNECVIEEVLSIIEHNCLLKQNSG